MTDKYKNNYKVFMDTINTLKNSQGYYGRLYNTITNMSVKDRLKFKKHINGLDTEFKNSVDVILFIEG